MKLHLGCGNKYLAGFTHIDLAEGEHIDFRLDIGGPLPFPDSSVDLIYSSHALEYFDRFEALEVLREWKRVLTTGGELYLSVPNFESLLEIYRQSGQDITRILGPLFGRWPLNDTKIYHRNVFDAKLLESILLESGFSHVASFNPVSFLSQFDANYDDYSLAFWPHMDRNGIQVSLCLSARA